MTPKQAARAVFVVVAATGRPGLITHREGGHVWVHHTDGKLPVQSKCTAADLERSTPR